MNVVNQAVIHTLEGVKIPPMHFILSYSKALKIVETSIGNFEYLLN